MKVPVFAVDVGYGNTKHAFRLGSDIGSGMFPSLSPLSAMTALSSYHGGVLASKRVVKVTVNDVSFDVGPDVPLTAAYGNTGRALTQAFAVSDNYAALLGGAFTLAGISEVDRLMLGLPVHLLAQYAPTLKERFTGDLDFGHGKIKVHRVTVVAQPMGSLVHMATLHKGTFTNDQSHLVIDVGYFTSDWLYANGYTMDELRSGGMPSGASQISQHIATMISADVGETIVDIERVDKALRDQKPFTFYEQEIDLRPYLERTQPLIRQAVLAIHNSVGPLSGTRAILLSGGGSRLYATVLRQTFPRVKLETVPNACMSNALGFLTIGETLVSRERAKGAK